MPKDQGRQTRQAEPKQKSRVVVQLNRLPAYLSILAIIVALVYCSILGNKVTVVLPATTLYSKDYYTDRAGNALNSSVFNHSKLTLNIRAFKEQIQSQIPEVSDVTVSIPLVGRKPVVGLSLVPAKFLLTMPDRSSYVIGSNGVVLADGAQLDAATKLSLQSLQEDVPFDIKVGKAVMTSSDIAFIDTVTSGLLAAHLDISLLQLPVGASELFVHLSGEPYIVKFALNGDPQQQVGAYLAVLHQIAGATPTNYVDVRVGERVYVK